MGSTIEKRFHNQQLTAQFRPETNRCDARTKDCFSPDSLMDDNELSAKCIESGSGECSQLYETGQQSIVLQSVNREIEAEEQMRQGSNEEGKLQSPIPASIHNSNLGEEEPFEDQVQQTQANT